MLFFGSVVLCFLFVFFFKQKTAYEMRISDGVQTCALPICDVVALADAPGRWRIAGWRLESFVLTLDLVRLASAPIVASADSGTGLPAPDLLNGPTIVHAFELPALGDAEIGRASCRERVCQYV